MMEVRFLVPADVLKKLSERGISLRHKDGFSGYFGDISIQEFWIMAQRLVFYGYRIDVTPGKFITLVCRKERNESAKS